MSKAEDYRRLWGEAEKAAGDLRRRVRDLEAEIERLTFDLEAEEVRVAELETFIHREADRVGCDCFACRARTVLGDMRDGARVRMEPKDPVIVGLEARLAELHEEARRVSHTISGRAAPFGMAANRTSDCDDCDDEAAHDTAVARAYWKTQCRQCRDLVVGASCRNHCEINGWHDGSCPALPIPHVPTHDDDGEDDE